MLCHAGLEDGGGKRQAERDTAGLSSHSAVGLGVFPHPEALQRLFSALCAPTRDDTNQPLQTGGVLHFRQGKDGKLQPASHPAVHGHPHSKFQRVLGARAKKRGHTYI